jgi:hypothetical protein
LSAAEIKSALEADTLKATEIEADVERAAKEGYGLVLLNTGSPAVCAVISEKGRRSPPSPPVVGRSHLTSEMKSRRRSSRPRLIALSYYERLATWKSAHSFQSKWIVE